jgi:hypothetical protein
MVAFRELEVAARFHGGVHRFLSPLREVGSREDVAGDCPSGQPESELPYVVRFRERGHPRDIGPASLPALVMKVGHAIPHQLNGDGENQKAKNLVDGSDCVGS